MTTDKIFDFGSSTSSTTSNSTYDPKYSSIGIGTSPYYVGDYYETSTIGDYYDKSKYNQDIYHKMVEYIKMTQPGDVKTTDNSLRQKIYKDHDTSIVLAEMINAL